MTLKKSSRKPPAYHRKVTGAHHRRSKRYHQTYWPYLPLLLIVFVGALFNTHLGTHHGVLDYATDMSVQELLDDTNSQRASNGLGALALNAKLNNAAQAKANDMAARDYWSHNTPDGQTPWTFFTAAGYDYKLAGENLAYGFTTATQTLDGWMNSPGHRANILNSGYVDVGFAYVNIPNYQSTGPETLVVAEYGAPQDVAAPAPTTPAPTTGNTQSKASSGAPVSETPTQTTPATTDTTPTPTTTPTTPTTSKDVATPTNLAKQKAKTTEPAQQHVSRIQLLTAGNASWSVAMTSLIGIIGLLFFLLRHGIAWHKIWIKGERYILHHPLLDIALVAVATLAYILTRTTGVIR